VGHICPTYKQTGQKTQDVKKALVGPPLFLLIEGRVLLVAKGTESDDARLLTTEEIAAILKVSLNTVQNRDWRKRNGCPLFRIGKRTYVLEARFWKWVNDRGMTHDVHTHQA
jgi:hypothetical protein